MTINLYLILNLFICWNCSKNTEKCAVGVVLWLFCLKKKIINVALFYIICVQILPLVKEKSNVIFILIISI